MPELASFLKSIWGIAVATVAFVGTLIGILVGCQTIIKNNLEIEKLRAEGYGRRNDEGSAARRARSPGANRRTVNPNAVLAASSKWADLEKQRRVAAYKLALIVVALLLEIIAIGYAWGWIR
jgi:hypothetical protein